jgi:hypothetical protein
MRWAGYMARMRRGEVFKVFWLGGHWEDLDVDGRIILR